MFHRLFRSHDPPAVRVPAFPQNPPKFLSQPREMNSHFHKITRFCLSCFRTSALCVLSGLAPLLPQEPPSQLLFKSLQFSSSSCPRKDLYFALVSSSMATESELSFSYAAPGTSGSAPAISWRARLFGSQRYKRIIYAETSYHEVPCPRCLLLIAQLILNKWMYHIFLLL